MYALVTSIATLLIGTVPLSTLWSIAPLLWKHFGAAKGSTREGQLRGGRSYSDMPHGYDSIEVAVASVATADESIADACGGATGATMPAGSPDAEHGCCGTVQEALRIRQRRAAGPSAPLGQGLSRNLSDEEDSSDGDADDICGSGNPWPRSVQLTSLLARKLP